MAPPLSNLRILTATSVMSAVCLAQEEDKMSGRVKSALDTLGTLLVIVAAGTLLWKVYHPASMAPTSRPPVERVEGLTISGSSVTHVRGTGAVVLVEFTDYECPFCARHAQKTGPSIKERLLDAGEIQHVVFNFPLPMHSRAEKAGEAAECAAEQGRFWEMHERLFDAPMALEIPDLVAKADALGLDATRFAQCLKDGVARARVRADVEAGQRLGVAATPAFFFGTREPDGTITLTRKINGALPFDTFVETVRDVSPIVRANN
jgi:protein-disulfide isomerase